MTAEIRYPGLDFKLGVDGRTPATALQNTGGGCVSFACASDVGFLCSFIDLLPCGPMWDAQKMIAKEEINEAGGVPVGGVGCSSMVSLAVFMAQVLTVNVRDILGLHLRETSPLTAVDTVDDWLDRYGWADCYRSACVPAFLNGVSPYTAINECGVPEYVATEFPEEFEAALKHAILKSVVRFSRGVIKNLDGINFIIEPLGARIDPAPFPDVVQNFLDGNTTCDPAVENCPPCFDEHVSFVVSSTGDMLPGAPTAESFCGETPQPVPASQEYDNGEGSVVLCPGVIAAECFVRAMLPHLCPNIVFNACPAEQPVPPMSFVTSTIEMLGNDTIEDGQTRTIRIVVTNSGTVDVGPLTVVARFPDGIDFQVANPGAASDPIGRTVTWQIAGSPVGTVAVLEFDIQADNLVDQADVTHSVTISPQDVEFATQEFTTATTDLYQGPPLFQFEAAITPTFSPPPTIEVGRTGTILLNVTNIDPSLLGSPVILAIDMPDGMTVSDFLKPSGSTVDLATDTHTWTPINVDGSERIVAVAQLDNDVAVGSFLTAIASGTVGSQRIEIPITIEVIA